MWIGVGMFERDDERLYDSYLMISPQGTIATRYRRIDPTGIIGIVDCMSR
jgi:predicted amidohydrolase